MSSDSTTLVIVDFWDSREHRPNYYSVPTLLAHQLAQLQADFPLRNEYHMHVLDALRTSPAVTMLFPGGYQSDLVFPGGVWGLWMQASIMNDWIKDNTSVATP